MIACNICGNTEFGPGHGGRIAPNNLHPSCLKCGAVERHRIVYSMYKVLAPLTKKLRALQFAPDNTLIKDNFKSLAFSTFNGENSLDMMNTGLLSDSYDIIISNHVMEHVKDHFNAIREIIRVVGKTGIAHICVPSPMLTTQTIDWGFADPARTWHYRWYGADAGRIFAEAVVKLHVYACIGRDLVTDTYDIVYFLSQSEEQLVNFSTILQRANFPIVVIQ